MLVVALLLRSVFVFNLTIFVVGLFRFSFIRRTFVVLCSYKLLYLIFNFFLFTMRKCFRVLGDVFYLLNNASTDSATACTRIASSIGTGGGLWYTSPYNTKEYIRLHVPKISTGRFSMMWTAKESVMHGGFEEEERAFPGLCKRWNYCGGRREPIAETLPSFIDMPLVQSFARTEYEGRLTSLVTQLRANGAFPKEVDLNS